MRALLLGLLLLSSSVMAQTEDRLALPRERLACLKETAERPRFDDRQRHGMAKGFMRLKLRFESPDAAPKIEALAVMADEATQRMVDIYLRGLRLPCLKAGEEPVEAIQEVIVSLDSPLREPAPVPQAARATAQCFVIPKHDIDLRDYQPRIDRSENLLAELTFDGDGQQAPKVRVLHRDGRGRSFELAVIDHLRGYRMPCRQAGEPPTVMTQNVKLVTDTTLRLSRPNMGLIDYLRLVKEPAKLRAYFDFNTMSCPFRVGLVLQQPKLANTSVRIDGDNPNREPFLKWLAALPFNFKNEDMARDLFSTQLEISVPCGTLDLNPNPNPGASS
jgi:hypothetical protein